MTTDCCSSSSKNEGQTESRCAVPATSTAGACPACGGRGHAVDRITLKALLTSEALHRIGKIDYRFCSSADCDVVYFANDSVFRRADVTVPVWQKSSTPGDPVCYCFSHSDQSLRAEIATTGASRAQDEIKRLVQEGKCACEVRNPQGTCCLGNVAKLIQKIQSEHEAVP